MVTVDEAGGAPSHWAGPPSNTTFSSPAQRPQPECTEEDGPKHSCCRCVSVVQEEVLFVKVS